MEKCKTTTQGLPAKKPNWRCGAPSGNRNAVRPVPSLSTIRRRIRALKKQVRAAIAVSDAVLKDARIRAKEHPGGSTP